MECKEYLQCLQGLVSNIKSRTPSTVLLQSEIFTWLISHSPAELKSLKTIRTSEQTKCLKDLFLQSFCLKNGWKKNPLLCRSDGGILVLTASQTMWTDFDVHRYAPFDQEIVNSSCFSLSTERDDCCDLYVACTHVIPLLVGLSDGQCFLAPPCTIKGMRITPWLKYMPVFTVGQYIGSLLELTILDAWTAQKNKLLTIVPGTRKSISLIRKAIHNDNAATLLARHLTEATVENVLKTPDVEKLGWILESCKRRLVERNMVGYLKSDHHLLRLWFMEAIIDPCVFGHRKGHIGGQPSGTDNFASREALLDSLTTIAVVDLFTPWHEVKAALHKKLLTVGSDIVCQELLRSEDEFIGTTKDEKQKKKQKKKKRAKRRSPVPTIAAGTEVHNTDKGSDQSGNGESHGSCDVDAAFCSGADDVPRLNISMAAHQLTERQMKHSHALIFVGQLIEDIVGAALETATKSESLARDLLWGASSAQQVHVDQNSAASTPMSASPLQSQSSQGPSLQYIYSSSPQESPVISLLSIAMHIPTSPSPFAASAVARSLCDDDLTASTDMKENDLNEERGRRGGGRGEGERKSTREHSPVGTRGKIDGRHLSIDDDVDDGASIDAWGPLFHHSGQPYPYSFSFPHSHSHLHMHPSSHTEVVSLYRGLDYDPDDAFSAATKSSSNESSNVSSSSSSLWWSRANFSSGDHATSLFDPNGGGGEGGGGGTYGHQRSFVARLLGRRSRQSRPVSMDAADDDHLSGGGSGGEGSVDGQIGDGYHGDSDVNGDDGNNLHSKNYDYFSDCDFGDNNFFDYMDMDDRPPLSSDHDKFKDGADVDAASQSSGVGPVSRGREEASDEYSNFSANARRYSEGQDQDDQEWGLDQSSEAATSLESSLLASTAVGVMLARTGSHSKQWKEVVVVGSGHAVGVDEDSVKDNDSNVSHRNGDAHPLSSTFPGPLTAERETEPEPVSVSASVSVSVTVPMQLSLDDVIKLPKDDFNKVVEVASEEKQSLLGTSTSTQSLPSCKTRRSSTNLLSEQRSGCVEAAGTSRRRRSQGPAQVMKLEFPGMVELPPRLGKYPPNTVSPVQPWRRGDIASEPREEKSLARPRSASCASTNSNASSRSRPNPNTKDPLQFPSLASSTFSRASAGGTMPLGDASGPSFPLARHLSAPAAPAEAEVVRSGPQTCSQLVDPSIAPLDDGKGFDGVFIPTPSTTSQLPSNPQHSKGHEQVAPTHLSRKLMQLTVRCLRSECLNSVLLNQEAVSRAVIMGTPRDGASHPFVSPFNAHNYHASFEDSLSPHLQHHLHLPSHGPFERAMGGLGNVRPAVYCEGFSDVLSEDGDRSFQYRRAAAGALTSPI